MKNLFLSLVLVMVGLVANSQVFVVKTDTTQYFSHPKSVKFVESVEKNLITYKNLYKTVVYFTIDLNKNTLDLVNSSGDKSSFTISEVFKSSESDVIVSFEFQDDVGNKAVLVVYKTEEGSTNLLVEGSDNDTTTSGYMCFNVNCKNKRK